MCLENNSGSEYEYVALTWEKLAGWDGIQHPLLSTYPLT